MKAASCFCRLKNGPRSKAKEISEGGMCSKQSWDSKKEALLAK